MSHLATATAQHNAADDQQEPQNERDDVAQASERRRRIGGGGKNRVDHSGLPPWKRLHDIASTINDRADPGRRGSNDWKAFLGRAQTGLREMLRWAPAPEPRVVRR